MEESNKQEVNVEEVVPVLNPKVVWIKPTHNIMKFNQGVPSVVN